MGLKLAHACENLATLGQDNDVGSTRLARCQNCIATAPWSHYVSEAARLFDSQPTSAQAFHDAGVSHASETGFVQPRH